jgi:hypothetical protein
MSNKWLTYFTGEEDRDEEEEKKKKEAAEAKKPTTWEEYFRQQSPEPEEGALPAVQPKKKEEASEQGAPSIIDRLAARGITVELPEPKKETAKDDGWGAIQPSLTGEGSALRDSAAKSTFTSTLLKPPSEKKKERDELIALAEKAQKDETVRDPEWYNSLRSEEEIQADLDAAKKDTVAANREDVKEGLLGDLKWLFSNGDRQKREKEDFNKNKRANAEKIQALEDELAERKWADYEQLRESGDFAQKSGYDKTNKVGETEINPAGGVRKSGYKDAKYAYINGDEDAGTELFINKTDTNNSAGMFGMFVPNSATEYQQYDEMTDDERSLYNYIHNTQGQEAADEYLDYLTSDLYARQAQREKNEARTYAMEHPVKASAATLAATPFRGMAFAGQTADLLANGKIDPNEPYNRIAYLPAAAREQVASDIEQNWGEWGSFGYQTGMSMLDFLINSKLSLGNEAFSLALMGTSAAADATMAAKERGLSDAQSWVLGAMAGAAEIISEKVSFEMLFNEVERKTHPIRYILQNALFEGLEEGESDVINWVADAIVSQDKSEWQEDIRAYQKDNPGTSENDAFWAVLLSRLKEGGLDMLGGSISGGLMAGMGVTEEKVLGNAQRNADRSAEIEATRRATQAVRDLTQGTAGTDITKGIQNAQQQAQTEQQIVLPTPDQNSGLPTGEETQAQENPVRAQEAQEQNTAAEPEGIVLSTGAEDAEAEMAAESKGGDTLRFGTEPETRTLTPTVEEAELNDAVDKAEAEGNITRATGIRYGVKEKTIRLMERLSEVTGRRIQFYRGQARNGAVENGFTNKSTGDIYLNVDAKQPFLITFGHEFTHNLEGTQAYKDLMNLIKGHAMQQGMDWAQRRADMRALYERGTGQVLSDAELDEEIAADWIGQNLSDEKTIREICRENPSAAKRIRDALDKFVIRTSNLGGVMSGYEQEKMQNAVKAFDRWLQREEQREETAQEAREAAQTGETAQAAVYPSAAETMQTSGAAEGTEGGESPAEYLARMGELYDAGEISEEEYEAAQDLAAEMESTGRGIETSTVERDEGPRGKIAEAFDRITRGGQVRASLSEEEATEAEREAKPSAVDSDGETLTGELRNGTQVKYSLSSWNATDKEQVKKNLSNAGFSSGEIDQYIIKMTNPLEVDVAGYDYAAHTENKDAMMEYIKQAEEEGRDGIILYHVRDNNLKPEEESSTDYLFRNPEQAKLADPVVYDDDGNVIPLSERFNDRKTDIRMSLSEDAERRIGEEPSGDTESWYFKNWFGDWQNDPENASKVVNPDGTPKVMYHGTNADQDFHIFNTYGANYGLYGGGSYFTDNPEVAQGYTKKGRGNNPRVYQVYLNIRNPIVMEQEADVDRWLDAIPELENYITKPGDSEITAMTNRDFYRAMEEYFADEGMYKWEAEEAAMDTLKNMGYDGINHVGGMNKDIQHDVWIAFDPEQIKSATENIGTYDPEEADIRYSLEEDRNDLAGLSQKAKAAALRIERQLTGDILQGIQRNVNPNSAEFRQFRADVARPVVEQLLRGEQADVDAVLESTGIDIVGQAAARGAVNDALRRANGELARIRTAVQESNARQQAREARNAELDAQIPDTSAGLIDLANRVKDAKKRLNTLKARTIMSEEDMEIAHQIATGQMTEEEARARYQYGIEDIVAMAEAEREAAEANAPWERYVKRLAQRRYEQADRDLENADAAKDKASGIQYARETAERNARDVFGKDAPAIIDDYFRPVHKSEAESTRFKNDYIRRVKNLKLNQKVTRGNTHSEAAAVQFLGEAEDNVRVLELARTQNAVRDGKTLNEWRAEIEAFKKANPNLDYGKVSRGIEEFQKIYDELITRMNEVLVENGYMPVNVRRGYFPHFNGGSDGILATFANLLGVNIDANALPTTINGLTSMFKPGKTWFGHAMERTGFATDYDAVQGFDGYIGGVSDVIHQTENLRNLRALATRIRYMMGDEQIKKRIDAIEADDSRTEQEKLAAIHDLTENGRYKLSRYVAWLDEYTNLLANKKSKYDRGVEDLMGRRFYTWMKNIEGRVAANMIAGNLGSALTNFIPLNQAGAMLGDYSMLRGWFDMVAGHARDDGFVSRSDFLTNRRGTEDLIRTTGDKISGVLSAPMEIIDNMTSEAIVRAAYGKYLRTGMDEQSAMQAADEFAAGVMADRSKGALPTAFGSHNPLMKLFTQFQVEVNNEFSTIFKDIPKGVHLPEKDRKNLVAKAAWTLLRYFIGAYLFNDLYEKVVGRRAALDPLDIANDAIGDLTGYKLNNTFNMLTEGVVEQQKKANPSDALMELGKNTAEELPFIGGLFGGGRIPINSALPDTETIVKGLTNENWSGEKKAQVVGRELGKTVGTYILPPFAGGAGKKAFQTVENTLAGGRYVKDAEGNDQLQYPYFTDTPADTAKTVAQSLLFGPTATEGGKAWVEGGFGNQSVKNTNLYKELTQEFGESQRESWNIINNIKPKDKYGNKMLVAESGLSEEGKAAAMEAVVNDGKSTEPQKFRAAYNNGVSADAWAALYGAMEEYDLNGNKQYTQAEIKEALDNITVPLSSGEGAAQGLFGGSTETRHLTNAEKAALWSAYDPTWATKNNPYDPAIGARVVAEYNRLKNEKAEESEDEE